MDLALKSPPLLESDGQGEEQPLVDFRQLEYGGGMRVGEDRHAGGQIDRSGKDIARAGREAELNPAVGIRSQYPGPLLTGNPILRPPLEDVLPRIVESHAGAGEGTPFRIDDPDSHALCVDFQRATPSTFPGRDSGSVRGAPIGSRGAGTAT